MRIWNLLDAQEHLEDVVDGALEHQPQRIEPGFGSGAVVVMSEEDYRVLTQQDLLEVKRSRSHAIAAAAGEIRIDPSEEPPHEVANPNPPNLPDA